MFWKKILKDLQKEKWEWSWNGGVPSYLLDILFLEPTKEYIKDLKHLKKYALITSDHGKKISAYMVKGKNSNYKCNLYFRKNIGDYIKKYKHIISKTNEVLLEYKESFRKENIVQIDYKKLIFLSNLLMENIKLYLISQPEVADVLGDELYKEIKLQNFKEMENDLPELFQPEKTILNFKKKDFKDIHKQIRKGNFSEEEIEGIIFDFYWKYRSFFMIDLNGNIKKELKVVKEQLKKEKLPKEEFKEIKPFSHILPDRIEKLINYIKEIGALRLEAKNTWLNLTLLIVNLVQQITKSYPISMSSLEKYYFKEVIDFLKTGRKKENIIYREKSVFVISSNKIIKYSGENFVKLSNIIREKIEKKDQVSGNVAYNGNVSGTAFIISLQDNLSDKIKEISKIKNPILIAEQTIPSYLPLIERSKGIVTNEGGILSHAAIVSREYKIPAIIGTKIATQIFNQGDKVVLDTEKGIVYNENNSSLKDEKNYYIVPLKIEKLNIIGGKARNTAILREIPSIDTSKGLILTTRLFSEMKENKKISKLLKNLKKDNSKIQDIHKEIENFPIPENLIKQLKNLLQNTNKIIVRSSATIEDSGSKSFAGQFVSEVSSVENIEKAIKLCFKGAFSLNLLSYIENVNQLNLALLIQEYKKVDKSGVAFSINPTNNYFNEMVIESVKGGCEKLVSGKVTPETLILERDTKRIPKSKILSKKELKLLKEKIKTIEKQFKTPIDIEWGIKGKNIWIFQARAITTI